MTDSPEVSGAVLPGYPEPLWIQAVHVIRGEIDRGVLRPGGRLPPERELCRQLGISRVTLRKALADLVEAGVLSPSHGRGWYVAQAAQKKEWPNNLESFSETASRMGLTPHSTVLRAETTPASIDEAEQLGIAPGTPLFRLERVRLLEGVPIALDLTWLRRALVPDIGDVDFTERSLYSTLSAAGVEPVRADSTIEATKADERAAEHLDLAPGDPVLVMRQLALSARQEPLFVSTIQYAGDRYRLRTSFARS
ncbi:putative GntR family transcriptional regulator [Actinacidiphila reveromycinica]|uniref:Putative GntR family transcriptional regulator n=1 Tax=Actinacidiphila reveromycinica TaxID=659352 RepID=A0A7U3V0I0_9ACTN|nr:GntR family transcriptional regulator [Streptomyces sp. SN-593]BBB02222.1 putative GntR family transcriptional regulator [Streptomyces sp. SN-593]